MPQVSVIIPTFNRCESLIKSIESVHLQTFQDFEIIVVNDGSTDDTRAFLDSLPRSYCTVIHFGQNKGGNQARNAGIQASSGSFIAFCDDDDLWQKEKLEQQIRFMQQETIDLCYCGVTIFDNQGRRVKYVFHRPKFPDDLYRSIMYDNFVGSTSMVILSRSSIESVGLFDPGLVALQDYDLFIRLLAKGFGCKGLDKSLASYVIIDEKRSISCNVNLFKAAAASFEEKYRAQPYWNLLRRRLRIIAVKRCVKSRRYLLDSFKQLLHQFKPYG
ncbi:MAG: glycosyltransferase family 2 protein [Chitinivibrionales bacterium]|nr:glycosyltransferase family 2 protein [Chitinivibrionales bacterium]